MQTIVIVRTLLILVLIAAGQTSNIKASESELVRLSVSTLTNLPRGISLSQFITRTGTQPTHQFSARLGSNEWLCVSVEFQTPRGSLYFVFEDEKLTAIVDPPPIEFETSRYVGNKPYRRPKAVSPEDKMNSVLSSHDLSASQIVERIQQWQRNQAIASQGQELNVLPAFLVTAPLWLAKAPAIKSANIEAENLAAKFDARKVKLGMSTNEVVALFGEPTLISQPETNLTLHVYGSRLPARASVHHPSVWIATIFDQGNAIRVFSHDFFDKRLVGENP